mgnify:CR=1 FL=1
MNGIMKKTVMGMINLNSDTLDLRENIIQITTVGIGSSGEQILKNLPSSYQSQIKKIRIDHSYHENISTALSDTDMLIIVMNLKDVDSDDLQNLLTEIATESPYSLSVLVAVQPQSYLSCSEEAALEQILLQENNLFDAILLISEEKAKLSKISAADVAKNFISTLISFVLKRGKVGFDFSDLCAILKKSGYISVGFGSAKGENCINNAVNAVLADPLLGISLIHAKGVLIHISGPDTISLDEYEKISDKIASQTNEATCIAWNMFLNGSLMDEIRVSVTVTGFEDDMDFQSYLEQSKSADSDDVFKDITKIFNKNPQETPPF